MRLSLAERCYQAAAPVGFAAAWCAAWASGTPRSELMLRQGHLPPATAPVVWLHGASAGEMAAAANLVATLRRAGYEFTAAYTAANQAGVDLAGRAGGDDSVATLAPWDVRPWLARSFERWQPRLLLLVETELWPGLVIEAHRRGAPVVCVSARIYARDVARYRLIRPLIGATLRRMTGVLAQDEIERTRFIALGVDPDRCLVAGNLKHTAGRLDRDDPTLLRAELGLEGGERVIVVGSVHEDEIGTVLDGLDAIRESGARVIIAPRHLEDSETVVASAGGHGWRVGRRSALGPQDSWNLLVLDTVGELARAYALATIAVVGGAFADHGGHNPVEAVDAGAPVLFGGSMQHFAPEAAALEHATPEAVVRTAEDLGRRLAAWLEEPRRPEEAHERQRRALPDAGAISQRYLQLLEPILIQAIGAPRT